jgi:2-octaprenyl-3-methyl-6-methoxy-1,4-benzoquinol hydroxylase/2-octaprenylphenol hydroxylase
MDNFDIIIVGGGMVGQAFALSMAKCHQRNLSIAIIEPNNPNPEVKENFHTRVSAITPTSEAFLKDIDVWDLIERKYAFTDTKVWDKNSHGALDFSIADDDSTHLGHIIENDCIQSAMYMALADSFLLIIIFTKLNTCQISNTRTRTICTN